MSSILLTTRLKYHTNTLFAVLIKPTGAPKGTIAKRELPTFPADCHYACQKKAWFDEIVMLEWVEVILKPYVADHVPPGIIPIILLDSFSVHQKGSVVNAIQALGVEVEFIPPGCTGLVQPVDVGYNKPFKSKLKAQFRNWMMLQDPDKPTPNSTRREVTGWIIEAERDIHAAMIRNAWKKHDFSYFPDQPKE